MCLAIYVSFSMLRHTHASPLLICFQAFTFGPVAPGQPGGAGKVAAMIDS